MYYIEKFCKQAGERMEGIKNNFDNGIENEVELKTQGIRKRETRNKDHF